MNDSHRIKLGYDRDETETDYHYVHEELAADFEGHDGGCGRLQRSWQGEGQEWDVKARMCSKDWKAKIKVIIYMRL